jgi:hypothetical protein
MPPRRALPGVDPGPAAGPCPGRRFRPVKIRPAGPGRADRHPDHHDTQQPASESDGVRGPTRIPMKTRIPPRLPTRMPARMPAPTSRAAPRNPTPPGPQQARLGRRTRRSDAVRVGPPRAPSQTFPRPPAPPLPKHARLHHHYLPNATPGHWSNWSTTNSTLVKNGLQEEGRRRQGGSAGGREGG